MSNAILMVDDDENILRGFERNLRRRFSVQVALGPEAGLAALSGAEPFAVVVSDLRMPGMDGVEFLLRVRAASPDSIRIMLTGQADLQDAIKAVNEGNIFRFLTKPCSTEQLGLTLTAALEQYHLIIAERELLEKTLSGAIQVLTDILSLANPEAFSRADRLKRIMRHLSEHLCLDSAWQYELAALFSQIGAITLPPDIVKKYYAGQALAPSEQSLINALPSVSGELLGHIPRLERVAGMIAGHPRAVPAPQPPQEQEPVDLGAQLLSLALAYDELVTRGALSHFAAVDRLWRASAHDQRLVESLKLLENQQQAMEKIQVSVFDLKTNMILNQDIVTRKGLLLMTQGQSISPTLIKSLSNYANRAEIEEQVWVLFHRS